MPGPETRYARAGGAHIAFQVLGDGPVDLVFLPWGAISIDSVDDEPHYARFHARLASFARLIRLDFRGIGLSDPLAPNEPPTLEQWADDVLAVLDTLGSGEVVLCGSNDGGAVAMLFAAMHPDRVTGLVLLNSYARFLRDVDFPCGLPVHLAARFTELTVDAPGSDESFVDLSLFAPKYAHDPSFRDWWRRAGNRGASPATARALADLRFTSDVRSVLPSVRAPALVVQRTENRAVRPCHGAYLAQHLPNARLFEAPGEEHLPFLGDAEVILDEIEESSPASGAEPPPPSATPRGSSASTFAAGCTSARSSCAATTSAGSPCTWPSGWSRWRVRVRSSCRGR